MDTHHRHQSPARLRLRSGGHWRRLACLPLLRLPSLPVPPRRAECVACEADDRKETRMRVLPASYDAWRLSGPDDDRIEIGMEEGETCNRLPEPDEDEPRGYRPRPCGGLMVETHGVIVCERCEAMV